MFDPSDEKIVLKPSTELIADEYEHFKETTANIAVHIFAGKDQLDRENADLFARTLKENKYDVDEKNVHSLDTDNFNEIINNICDGSKDLDGLILFFSGVSTREGMMRVCDGQNITNTPIQHVVTKFTSYNCAALKNKPKIFIFHLTSPSEVQIDGIKRDYRFSYDLTYDTPAEADMLLVYKKTENSSDVNFINKLCENINKHGKNEDIINLVTYVESASNESRPLIISTLTRNFFFTQSEYRGHHFHINEHHKELKEHLEDIRNQLSQVKTTGKTKNSKTTPKNNTVKSINGTSNRSTNTKQVSSARSAAGSSKRNSKELKDANIQKSTQAQLVRTDGGSSTKKTTEQTTYTQTRTSRLRSSSTRTDGSASNADVRGSRSRLGSDKSDADKSNKPRWK